MKVKKGEYGYINSKKKKQLIITIIMFAAALLVFAIGYISTKTRANALTIVAVLGLLPASKSMVGLIMIGRYQTFERERYEAFQTASEGLTMIYDLVVTSYEKAIQIDSIAVMGNTICGYSGNKKADLSFAETFLAGILKNNGYAKISIKLFSDETVYIRRLNELASKAGAEEQEDRNKQLEAETAEEPSEEEWSKEEVITEILKAVSL